MEDPTTPARDCAEYPNCPYATPLKWVGTLRSITERGGGKNPMPGGGILGRGSRASSSNAVGCSSGGAWEIRKAVTVEPGARLTTVLQVLPDQEPRGLIEVVLQLLRSVAGGLEAILGRNLVDHLSHLLAPRREGRPEPFHKSYEGDVPGRAAGRVQTDTPESEFSRRRRAGT